MKTIGPVDWAIIMWSLVGRGLLEGVVGHKPMVPIVPVLKLCKSGHWAKIHILYNL